MHAYNNVADLQASRFRRALRGNILDQDAILDRQIEYLRQSGRDGTHGDSEMVVNMMIADLAAY